MNKTRICWFGIYNPEYPRNRILLKGLRDNGVVVVECRADGKDRLRYVKLAIRLFKMRHSYDVIFAAFPSPVAAIVARIVSRKFLVVDAFYSMYDAVVNDRKEISRWHPRAIKLLFFDWLSLLCANLIITDTDAHKAYWSSWWGVNPKKIQTLYIGVDAGRIRPAPNGEDANPLIIHFHGSYVPLQGIDAIVSAAGLLKDESKIKFRLIGDGQDFERNMKKIAELGAGDRIEIIRRVPYDELIRYLGEADIVLGIFGNSAKARRVIPHKVYEGAAVGKPIITMDSPAIREVFSPGKDILLILPNGSELAKAITHLSANADLRHSIGNAARTTAEKYAPKHVAARLYQMIPNENH